jgi:hypothetical protein
MTAHLKTPEAAKQVGVSYHQLMNLIRFGKISRPARDSSGDYLWAQGDLDHAREVFSARRLERIGAASGPGAK